MSERQEKYQLEDDLLLRATFIVLKTAEPLEIAKVRLLTPNALVVHIKGRAFPHLIMKDAIAYIILGPTKGEADE